MAELKTSRFVRLIAFIKEYRISPVGEQLRGIKDTLIGWCIIAYSSVFFKPILDPITIEISFLIMYLAGALTIFLNVLLDGVLRSKLKAGLRSLLIVSDNEKHSHDEHISVSQRRKIIYIRAFLATGGYIALNIAKIYFGVVDNSSIFGADALIFVLLSSWILHEKRNLKEWTGILIACAGVFFILFLDLNNFQWLDG